MKKLSYAVVVLYVAVVIGRIMPYMKRGDDMGMLYLCGLLFMILCGMVIEAVWSKPCVEEKAKGDYTASRGAYSPHQPTEMETMEVVNRRMML